ncbi:MAG: type II secretion system protein [bacterium]
MKASACNRGFTFAEMVASAAIMTVLASSLVATTTGLINYSKAQSTRAELLEIKDGSERFFKDTRAVPTSLSDLYALPAGPSSQWRQWRGPYLSRSATDTRQDAWNHNYGPDIRPPPNGTGLRSVVSSSGIATVLVVSPGKNGALNRDYMTLDFANTLWAPGGDDIALQFVLRVPPADLEDETRNTLDLARARILNDNSNAPPNNWGTASYVDAWGNRIRFVRCTDYQAYIFSWGPNGVDDSSTTLCSNPVPNKDDIVNSIVWERRTPVTTHTWTGGAGPQPTTCASYTLTVVNNYPNGNVIVTQGSGTLATVNAGTSETVTATPDAVHIRHGTTLVTIDDFYPASADLNSDCQVRKSVGLEPPP